MNNLTKHRPFKFVSKICMLAFVGSFGAALAGGSTPAHAERSSNAYCEEGGTYTTEEWVDDRHVERCEVTVYRSWVPDPEGGPEYCDESVYRSCSLETRD